MPKARQDDLKRQIAELTEALQRERADAINIRRRHEEQLARIKDVVKADVMQDLLPVIDNFERSLSHVPKELEKNDYVKGVKSVVKQFEKTLEKIGVKKIETVGKAFDPRLHEAVSVEEGKGSKDIVASELQSGYVLGEEVLRPAMVKVKNQ